MLGVSYVDASQPNIVIVIADDQGYGDLGHTGNEQRWGLRKRLRTMRVLCVGN